MFQHVSTFQTVSPLQAQATLFNPNIGAKSWSSCYRHKYSWKRLPCFSRSLRLSAYRPLATLFGVSCRDNSCSEHRFLGYWHVQQQEVSEYGSRTPLGQLRKVKKLFQTMDASGVLEMVQVNISKGTRWAYSATREFWGERGSSGGTRSGWWPQRRWADRFIGSLDSPPV